MLFLRERIYNGFLDPEREAQLLSPSANGNGNGDSGAGTVDTHQTTSYNNNNQNGSSSSDEPLRGGADSALIDKTTGQSLVSHNPHLTQPLNHNNDALPGQGGSHLSPKQIELQSKIL